jgi:hypothetical protein
VPVKILKFGLARKLKKLLGALHGLIPGVGVLANRQSKV